MSAIELITKTPVQFFSKELNTATNQIYMLGDAIKSNMYRIAWIIAQVDANQAYTADNFKNVHEWTSQAFGFKKSLSYTLLKVGREYTREVISRKGKVTGYCSNLVDPPRIINDGETAETANPEPVKDFTVSQVEVLLPLGHERIVDMVRDATINPDMTVKELKKLVRGEKDSTENEPDDTGDTSGIQGTEGERKSIFDNISTAELIQELKRRGFTVHDGQGREMKVEV